MDGRLAKVVRSRALAGPRSDVPKPGCPWCGGASSTVDKSVGDLFEDVYRRRRQCGECGRKWWTVECLDLPRLVRALRRVGLTLADLGLEET